MTTSARIGKNSLRPRKKATTKMTRITISTQPIVKVKLLE